MHQTHEEMKAGQLRAELQQLKEQKDRLEEENEALNIRANGVKVLSKLLDQSRLEAVELKRKLSEKTADDKGWSVGSNDAMRRASSSGSLEKSSRSLGSSLNMSPWNTNDADILNEVMAELKYLLDKNKELTIEFEQALKDQARMNGDDGILVEHLNRLKVELERYQSRLQGQGDWPRKLQDEANRMKTKLTDIAIQRGTTCGRLQEEIDSVKQKLRDIEVRITSKTTDNAMDSPMEIEEALQMHNIEKAHPQSSGGARPRPTVLDEATLSSESVGDTPAVKPRTDLKGEINSLKIELQRAEKEVKSLKGKLHDVEQENDILQMEKEELVKVNHDWDAQYRRLQEYLRKELRGRDDAFQKLQRELSQEHHQAHSSVKELLDQKDTIIEEQALKIRSLKEEMDKATLEGMQKAQRKLENDTEAKYQRAKKLFQDQKRENDILIRKEETALQENQVLKDAVEVLERETKSLNARNRMLEGEIERLAVLVEQPQERRHRSSPASLSLQDEPPFGRPMSRASEEQIEVLKQQISIYVEDFNTEKQEKEKLIEEVKRLKIKLKEAQNEAADCLKQMKIFENDYNLEREDKLRQGRIVGYGYEEGQGYMRKPPSPRVDFQDEDARLNREYRQLRDDHSKIADRMAEFERRQRRPERFTNSVYNARGASQVPSPPQPFAENTPENEMFFGGQVVRDGSNPELACHKPDRSFDNSSTLFRHKLDHI